MLYAAAILWGGIRFKNRYITNCGIFIVCVTLLRVITYDIINLPIVYKLLLFLVLGVALLVTSYYYSKCLGNKGADKFISTNGTEPELGSTASSTTSQGVSSKDTQELKDIEIPDLTDQNAFKKVDSAASQSPFSDRLSGAANVGTMDSSVAESKNNLEETTAVKAAQTSPAMDKPSWHND